jgi:hypothetical protein
MAWRTAAKDPLLPLTTDSYMAVQFSSFGDLSVVILIACNVPKARARA